MITYEQAYTRKVLETVIELSRFAQHYLDKNNLVPNDSVDLSSSIINWAEEFEVQHAFKDWDSDGDDYFSSIEDFAADKISEYREVHKVE